MAKIKSKKGKKQIKTLVSKKACFRRVNYKKHHYTFPNIKCSTCIAIISKIPFLLKKKQMDFLLFKLNRLLKTSSINIYNSIIFDKIMTKKPKQSRMGKGKAEMADLIGNVSTFDTVFEFSFNIKEKKEKKKKRRKLLKNKIRLINLNEKFLFFDKNLGRYYKMFRLKRFVRKKKKKKKYFLF